jgi:hypothetical protein
MLYDELKKREEELQKALSLCNQKLKNTPEGSLRVSVTGKRVQFYQRKNISQNNGTYIRKKNSDLVRRLAEKEYYNSLKKIAGSELSLVQKLLNLNPRDSLLRPHTSLEIHKKTFVTPFEVSNET